MGCLTALLHCAASKTDYVPKEIDPNTPGREVDRDASIGADAGGVGEPDAAPAKPTSCKKLGPEIAVTQGAGVETFTMYWDVDHYVFVYGDKGSGNSDVTVLFADENGKVTSGPTRIDATDTPSRLPTLARTATDYVVVWEEGSTPRTLRARRINLAGQPTGNVAEVATSNALETRPVLAWGRKKLVATWMDTTADVPTAFFAELDGTLAHGAPTRLGDGVSPVDFPWTAGDDTNLAVIWSDRRTESKNLRFATLSDSLAAENDHELRNTAGDAVLGRLIRTGFGYLAAWEDTRSGDTNEIRMALTDPLGNRIADGLVEEPGTGDANWPNMAWNGSATAITYYQFRNGAPQIFVTFVDSMGLRVANKGDLQVSATPSGRSARYPDIQWNGSTFGVAWIDSRDSGTQIYFAKIDCLTQ